MLDDRRLEQLLRAGHEVDSLDAEVARPAGRIGPRTARWETHMLWGAVAAAAVIGVSIWALAGGGSQSPDNGGGSVIVVAPPVGPSPAPVDPAVVDEHGTVVMAIVEDDRGELRCVKWSPGSWGSRPLSALKGDELRAMGMAMVCADAPKRLLVVGMEGPRKEMLPANDAHAADVAKCILSSPSCGSGTFDSGRCAQAGCVGSEVNVRVESVAWK
ncbi:MAG: hypothetical protein ACREJO_16710 [Phycisphaerales bacterium]